MTQDGPTRLRSSDPLISLLARAKITKSSLIRVTGSNGLSAILWLCRHGFDQVGFVKAGPGCPHEQADALLIAHRFDEQSLRQLLATGPHVREGGVLVFQSPLPSTAAGRSDPIHWLLESHGYIVEQCVHGAHREVHVARRQAHAWQKAA